MDVVACQICGDLTMPAQTDRSTRFVDLFYGVVAGSSVAMLSWEHSHVVMLSQVVWLLALLEDWFLYYTVVSTPKAAAVRYTFRSLLFEFSILTAWYLAFNALSYPDQPDRHEKFFLMFVVFYGFKTAAGVSHYYRRGQWSRMSWDFLWLLPVGLGILFYCRVGDIAFDLRFYCLAAVTLVTLVAWWVATKSTK
jgi:hypothetical protein